MEYAHIGVPRILRERFQKIQSFYGYRNFNEFAVAAIRDTLRGLENRAIVTKWEREKPEDDSL